MSFIKTNNDDLVEYFANDGTPADGKGITVPLLDEKEATVLRCIAAIPAYDWENTGLCSELGRVQDKNHLAVPEHLKNSFSDVACRIRQQLMKAIEHMDYNASYLHTALNTIRNDLAFDTRDQIPDDHADLRRWYLGLMVRTSIEEPVERCEDPDNVYVCGRLHEPPPSSEYMWMLDSRGLLKSLDKHGFDHFISSVIWPIAYYKHQPTSYVDPHKVNNRLMHAREYKKGDFVCVGSSRKYLVTGYDANIAHLLRFVTNEVSEFRLEGFRHITLADVRDGLTEPDCHPAPPPGYTYRAPRTTREPDLMLNDGQFCEPDTHGGVPLYSTRYIQEFVCS